MPYCINVSSRSPSLLLVTKILHLTACDFPKYIIKILSQKNRSKLKITTAYYGDSL